MNAYSIIILTALLAGFALDLVSGWLNIRNQGGALPDELKDVYPDEIFRKSAQYTITSTKFQFISSAFSLAVVLLFWFWGGFPWLESIVEPLSNNLIIKGLCYISILVLANTLLGLPFSIYSTFVIEEKFGFNRTTAATFTLDHLKSLALGLLIGLPLLALVLYILDTYGSWAWLAGWAAVTLVTLIIQYVGPMWIMPLFNKFTPLGEGSLRDKIMNFAAGVNFPLKNIFVIDGSRRSSRSNAFFTGFGRNKRIALYDTLIEKHSQDELVAVLAHEIGHYKLRHIATGSVMSILHTGVLFYLLSVFLTEKGMYEAFFMTSEPIYAGLLFFGMLYAPAEMLLGVIFNIISRKHEYAADRFAAVNTKSSESMISALKKLSTDNLSNPLPHPFYVFINYSHPTVLQRIRALRAI